MAIKAIETVYNGYRFRSRLEARWAVFFDAAGIVYEYEPEGFDLAEAGRYLPDFWLLRQRRYIEIKPITLDSRGRLDTSVPQKFLKFSSQQQRTDNNEPVLIRGTPGYVEARKFYGCMACYQGETYTDYAYFWCECPFCGSIDMQFEARWKRNDHRSDCAYKTKRYIDISYADCKLTGALNAARGARFEHGETPAGRHRHGWVPSSGVIMGEKGKGKSLVLPSELDSK